MAGNIFWNPVWDEDNPNPWYQIAGQNVGSGLAGAGAGAAAGAATGAGTSRLLRALGKSPKAQALGAGLGALGGFLGAGIPTTSAVFDALGSEDE